MKHLFFMPVLFALMLGGCATVQISADYDPQGDFTGLQSFAWMHEKQPVTGNAFLDNDVLNKRIRRAVDEQLISQGLQEVPKPEADFLLRYHVTIKDKTDITTFGSYDGYMWNRPYSRAAGPGLYYHSPHAQTQTFTTHYQEGTLVVDVIQPEADQLALIWRGTAQAEVKPSLSPEKRETRLRKAVDDMFAYFPPPTKS